MKNAVEQLGMYQSYHYDARNCATHFVGIPLIIFGVMAPLDRVVLFDDVRLGTLVMVATLIYYCYLNWALGLAMAVAFGVLQFFALQTATLPQTNWLIISLGAFIVGWILQAVGHVFEKRRPAFADNLMQLLIGPLFLMFETFSALKINPALHQAVMQRALQLHPPATRNKAQA